MVKAIFTSPISRKIATTAMLTTAVLGANATSLKTGNQNNTTNQTEVVSKEAALAIKNSTTMSNNTPAQETKSFAINNRLAQMFLETCENEQEIKDTKESIKYMFSNFGTFGATVEGQINLEEHYAQEAIKELATYSDFNKLFGYGVADYLAKEFPTWLNNTFYKEFLDYKDKIYTNTNAPSAEECIKVLDEYVINSEIFDIVNEFEYSKLVKAYEKKQNEFFQKHPENYDTIQVLADRIAIRVHAIMAQSVYAYFTCQFASSDNYLKLRITFNELFPKIYNSQPCFPEFVN
jgi:hypothetical protein